MTPQPPQPANTQAANERKPYATFTSNDGGKTWHELTGDEAAAYAPTPLAGGGWFTVHGSHISAPHPSTPPAAVDDADAGTGKATP